MAEFHTLTTEQKNLSSLNIDKMSGAEIARCINEEDKTVAFAVEKCLPEIGEAIELLNFWQQTVGDTALFATGDYNCKVYDDPQIAVLQKSISV